MNRVALLVAVIGNVTVLSAQAPSSPALAFEVVSVRPNRGSDLTINFPPEPPDGITLVNHPLESIIRYAYDVQSFRVIGMPAWALDERFDILARAATPINDAERRVMVRALLTTRFQLKARFETREQTAYVLTTTRPDGSLGPGLRPRPDCLTGQCRTAGSSSRVAGVIRVRAIRLDALVDGALSSILGGVVRNETGVQGTFDAELSFRPDTADQNDSRPAFFTAVEEQFGLKLTPQRRPVDVLVIESVARPTPD